MPQKRMECFRLLLEHLPWIEHQFLSGIKDSRKAESLWGMMRGVGGVRKSLWDNWGDERGYDKGDWHAHTRGLPWGLPEVVGTVQEVHCNWRRLLRRGQESHMCTTNKSVHTKKILKLIVCTSYIYIYINTHTYIYSHIPTHTLTHNQRLA